MFKSFKKIIIILVFLIICMMIPYMAYQLSNMEGTNLSEDATIVVDDNGKIVVTDKISFKYYRDRNIYVNVPLILKKFDLPIKPENLIVTLDGQAIETSNGSGPSYSLSREERRINNKKD